MRQLLAIVITALIFLSLDMIWLGHLGKQLYIDALRPMLRLSGDDLAPNIAAAAIVYVALVSGLVFLVFPLAGGSVFKALAYGAFFGFVTYATYDFTNLAVLTGWRWDIAIIDTIWGMFLCATTSAGAVYLMRFF